MQYILTRESLKFLDGIYNINNLPINYCIAMMLQPSDFKKKSIYKTIEVTLIELIPSTKTHYQTAMNIVINKLTNIKVDMNLKFFSDA